MAKTLDGSLVQGLVYAGDQVVAELGPSGEVRTRFVYASRGNVADYLVRGSRTYRIVADHLGSVRLVVDAATGEVVQRLDYDAFGRTRLDTNPGFQPFGYAGGLVDEHTALVHFGARDYDPALGRWTTRDPVGFGGGANHYAFVGNDPVNNIDPSGLSAIGCLQDVLGLAGMLPVVGGAFDLANAAIYASRGSWGDAGLALGAVLLSVSLAGLGGAAKAGARWGDDAAGAATGVGAGATDAVGPSVRYNRATHYGGAQTNSSAGRALREGAEGSACPSCGRPQISGRTRHRCPSIALRCSIITTAVGMR